MVGARTTHPSTSDNIVRDERRQVALGEGLNILVSDRGGNLRVGLKVYLLINVMNNQMVKVSSFIKLIKYL